MKLKSAIPAVLLLPAALAHAQACVNNTDSSGNVCTSFTLGAPTANCIPVLTQDGVAQNGGAVCPGGFFGGGGMQVELPSDPVDPGYPLTSYICSTSVLSNTIPSFSSTPKPPGSLIQGLTCTVEYPWYTATWTGTLEYDYVSVRQTHCSGGRGGGCHTGYFPVATGGSGEIATAPPPAPPPPPPQPVVISTNIGPSACDPSLVCTLVAVDTTSIAGAIFDINGMTLQVMNADGTVDTYALDSVNMSPMDDDGKLYIVSGSGEIYDADGNLVKSVSVVVNLAIDEDTGQPSITSGTLEVTIQPPQ